jgi:hypothetical protein
MMAHNIPNQMSKFLVTYLLAARFRGSSTYRFTGSAGSNLMVI